MCIKGYVGKEMFSMTRLNFNTNPSIKPVCTTKKKEQEKIFLLHQLNHNKRETCKVCKANREA